MGSRTRSALFARPPSPPLRLWRERLLAGQEELARLGFDEVFSRMWLLYLCYAEAGFRSGYLDVWQFLLAGGPDAAAGGLAAGPAGGAAAPGYRGTGPA